MSKGPKPPDPGQTANQQQQYNIGAGGAQQRLNMVNQTTPFGSLAYSQTGTNPDGTPIFSAQQSYTPQVQSSVNNLLGQINQGPGDVTGQQMNLYNKYYQPLIDQQQTALDSSLANKGIFPGANPGGNQAYNNAQNQFQRNVGDQRTNWLLNSAGLGMQETALPYNLLNSLRTGASPGFASTPTASVQPPNYQGLVEQNYQNQLASSNALNQGLFGIGGALGGGWARTGWKGL